ncbi:hypothetical protein B296_00010441 [Ensete ventricosum]|uniref:Uncharacterized protein n=1 Tax=Ensete ventricosum TaxID=4639 RepID=A0A426YHY7_ENSVE|nr:hypothetical protein B296_00010441 [Ensete ventricosum]
MIQVIVPYIPQLTQPSNLQHQPTAMQQLGDEPPQTLLEHNLLPMGDPMGRHTTTVSTSVHSMPDPDTLSSVSIDSLRAHLRLINQKIDNVQKEFIKLKEGVREGNDNIDGSPFVLEVRDK